MAEHDLREVLRTVKLKDLPKKNVHQFNQLVFIG